MKIILALLFVSCVAQAGIRDVGNGGRGVLINDKPYLLDLYEAGNLAPKIDHALKSFSPYQAAVKDFSILSESEKEILVKKLTEIREQSPVVADQLVAGLRMYVWRVLDQALVEIPEKSPIASPLKQVQLANRLDFTIRLNKHYWDQMDAVNKVALVLHEVFYAYADTIEVAPGIEEQQSFSVRSLVGYVFSPEMKTRGRSGFTDVSHIPWARSRVLKNNNIEALQASIDFVAEGVTFGNIGAEDEDFGAVCSQVAKALRGFGRNKSVKFTLSYVTSLIEVSFENYLSPTGQQKKLVMGELMGAYKRYPTAEITFKRANINTCAPWIQKQVTKYATVDEFPQLPE